MKPARVLRSIAAAQVALVILAATLAAGSSAGAAGPGAGAAERPLDFLPTDHWAYEELEKLWVGGFVDSVFVSSRPASRYDLAVLVMAVQQGGRVPAGYAPMERLLREFSREISYLGGESGYRPFPYMIHTRSEKVDFRISPYVDAEWTVDEKGLEDSRMVETTVEGSRIGVRATTILRPNLLIHQDVYAGKVTDGWKYGEELFSIPDFIIFSDRFYLGLASSVADVQVGRDRVRWGPGRTGTLLLSDGAATYTLLQVTRAFGRKVKVSSVSGILNAEDGKYLAAHRLDFAPSSFVQLGLSETAVYHSDFLEPLYVVSLIPFTLVERILHRDAQDGDVTDPERNNVSVSADAVVRPVRGASLYGELMIDDFSEETSQRPTRLAYQAGLALSRPVGSRSVNFTAELTRVWNYTYTVYYSDVYDRDQTHQGRPLGYYLGPDTRHLYFSVSTDLSRDFEVAGQVDVIHRGEGSLSKPWTPDMVDADASSFAGVVERTTDLKLIVRWLPVEVVRVEVGVARVMVKNRDHETDPAHEDWRDTEYSLGVTGRW